METEIGPEKKHESPITVITLNNCVPSLVSMYLSFYLIKGSAVSPYCFSVRVCIVHTYRHFTLCKHLRKSYHSYVPFYIFVRSENLAITIMKRKDIEISSFHSRDPVSP
jgi:hypothetical protein